MPRLCLALVLSVALPAIAAAQGLSAENCRATRDILSQVIEGRKAGLSAEAVTARLSEGEDAVDETFVETVPPLVTLAYSLEPDMLTDQVAEEYETQCLSYKP